jgi:hypothetical protein
MICEDCSWMVRRGEGPEGDSDGDEEEVRSSGRSVQRVRHCETNAMVVAHLKMA